MKTPTKAIRTQYIEQGYDCIPLKPSSKLPFSSGWQVRDPFLQWRGAAESSNFGLRAGNGKAFIDCDDKSQPGTFSNVSAWLEGLGYSPAQLVIVQSASGIGRHVYVNFAGAMLGSVKKLKIGAGEFRFGAGAYVTAPPSVVDGGEYRIISGDLAHLPTLDARDIATLINPNELIQDPKPSPKMSRQARSLANGQGLERYASRSEAEAALTLSLINSGFDLPEIRRIFETCAAFGKYAELRAQDTRKAEAYLSRTYDNALEYSRHESPARRKIRELQDLAERAAWSKASDRIVFLAHSQIAYKAGRFEYAASSRDLALEAGLASNRTASNATQRLMDNELLKLEERSAAIFANRYSLQVDKVTHFLTSTFLGSVQECPSQVVQDGRVLDLERLETADAFRNGRGKLGRRAGQVYKLLFLESRTAAEIARRTGASLKTVRRVLKKLAAVKDYKTGEILELVTCGADGHWYSNVVDLDILEAIYRTRGAREKQRMYYEAERRDHKKSLMLGALKSEAA